MTRPRAAQPDAKGLALRPPDRCTSPENPLTSIINPVMLNSGIFIHICKLFSLVKRDETILISESSER